MAKTKPAKGKTERKEPFGRPTKYDPKYCHELIAFVVKKKLPIVSFAAHLRIDESTLYEWAKAHDDFSKSIKIAKTIGKSGFIDRAVKSLDGKARFFNTGAFAMIMKNCYGWSDNPDTPDEELELLFS